MGNILAILMQVRWRKALDSNTLIFAVNICRNKTDVIIFHYLRKEIYIFLIIFETVYIFVFLYLLSFFGYFTVSSYKERNDLLAGFFVVVHKLRNSREKNLINSSVLLRMPNLSNVLVLQLLLVVFLFLVFNFYLRQSSHVSCLLIISVLENVEKVEMVDCFQLMGHCFTPTKNEDVSMQLMGPR